jgi:hypothetical protein
MAVHVTISNFTPKPHTPFQWHSVSTAEFERKRAMLREAFSNMYQVGSRHDMARLLGSSVSPGLRDVSPTTWFMCTLLLKASQRPVQAA